KSGCSYITSLYGLPTVPFRCELLMPEATFWPTELHAPRRSALTQKMNAFMAFPRRVTGDDAPVVGSGCNGMLAAKRRGKRDTRHSCTADRRVGGGKRRNPRTSSMGWPQLTDG